MIRFRLLATCAVVSVLLFSTADGRAQRPAGPDYQFVPNEMLVQFARGASATQKANARARVQAVAVETVAAAHDNRGDLELVRLAPGRAVADAVRGIQGEAVTFAEPNWIYTTGLVSNDTYFTNGSLWGMYSST